MDPRIPEGLGPDALAAARVYLARLDRLAPPGVIVMDDRVPQGGGPLKFQTPDGGPRWSTMFNCAGEVRVVHWPPR